ncbi:MAG: type I-D CRISPR-associated helicase Cas3' [Veillonellaceae bacterium]|nr:type I-D CRISPR-associated helicase Cas3' [Veillonellaceae bacterium]
MPVVDDIYGLSKNGRLRAFQKEFIDCIKEDNAEVLQLIAPTGAGKTLCFEYLLNEGNKVLLLYPTNALIQSQLARFNEKGFRAINISSKILKKKGPERAQELWGLLSRYDIILTNPDIFQAIIGAMYINPAENLIQVFHQFQYVIYDEFHAYREFELSGILTQIALFQNMSHCRVILSSATPKSEIVDLLGRVRIGKDRHAPLIRSIVAEPCSADQGDIIRHRTNVEFHQGKILDHLEQAAQVLYGMLKNIKDDKPQILFIFDSVKDSNRFFSQLYKTYPDLYKYAEKDNGYDTNQVGDAPILTKPILISTNKSEVGLDYPIKLLFMEDGFSFDSFVQRFGRAARHEPAECYIYTKKEAGPIISEEFIEYKNFLDKINYITNQYNIKTKSVFQLFTFRQALAIMAYARRRKDLMAYFAVQSGYSYKLWLAFFSILDRHKQEGLANYNLDKLCLLLADIKEACKSLRGRSLQLPVIYQRGHEIRQTTYDVLSVLNRVPAVIENTEEGLIVREIDGNGSGPFIKAITIPYFPVPINYQKRDEQFRDEVNTIAEGALDVFPEDQKYFLLCCVQSLCNAIEPDRIFVPEEVILWNDKIVPLSKLAMEFDND